MFPLHKLRESVTVGRHEVVGGNLEVVDKRGYGNGGMQRNQHVDVVRHAIDAVELALVVLAKAKDIHIEVALISLGYGSRTLMGAEDDVIDEFGVCHDEVLVLWIVQMGHPFRVHVGRLYANVRGCSLRSYPRLLSGDAFSVTGESVGVTYIQVPACCLYSMCVDKKMSRRVG